MSSTDSRIVTIKFDNTQFKREAQTTMTALDKLKQNMNFSSTSNAAKSSLGTIGGYFSKLKQSMGISGVATSVKTHLSGISNVLGKFGIHNPFAKTTDGLSTLQGDANKFSMTGITGGITEVNKSWMAMSTVAVTALATITNAAVTHGAQWAKSLTLDQVIGGFQEYETQMNSIQTIMANTGREGKKGLEEVNHALDELNHYSDQTIYNFTEMAKNIGTFTAAGVDLETSVQSIKGIANLAAISGSNSQQASTAMYQLSQALASGKVSLMDWNSVVNAGMGGKIFQEALTRTAVQMGELDKSAVKMIGPMKTLSVNGSSFRDSISSAAGQKNWLSSGVLTNTLKQLSGDMTEAELRAEGFSDAQVKAIMDMGKMGQDAATKVKTLTQLITTVKEAISSGWAQSFEIVFGNFNEAKRLFTDVSDTIGEIVKGSATQRNKLLESWKDLGGREAIIKGISNIFHALLDVLQPIGDAFRDIFPAKTAQDLMNMSEGFRDFTAGLSISDETAANLKRTFSGVFAIFHTIGSIIGGVIGLFGRLGGAVGESSGGFLDFTGGIGEFLVHVDNALTKGGMLEKFFDGLGDIIAVPLTFLRSVARTIGGLFSGFDTVAADAVGRSVDNVTSSLEPVSELGKSVGTVFGKLGGWMSDAADAVVEALSGIGEAIAGSIGPKTFEHSLSVINTALIGGIVLMLRNFVNNGIKIDFGGGVFDSIKQTLGAVTDHLSVMQTQVKADIIMKIAIALGVLAGAIFLLSTIDPDKLAIGLGGMVAGFAALQIGLVALTKYITYMGTLKLPFIIAGIMGLAGALLVMSIALKIMSTIDLGSLVKALLAFGASLYLMQKALTALGKNRSGILRTATAMLILGVAMNTIAIALKIFATMSLDEIGRGLLGLAGSLAVIAGAMRLMPRDMLAQSVALTAVGVALNLIAVSMRIFGRMKLEDIGKALVAMGGAMAIIAGAMHLMPANLPLTAAGLIAVSIALNLIGAALRVMGGMSWEQIAKGLVALGGAMAILAIGLNFMNGTLMGSAALMVAAMALTVLTPVLLALGAMSWEMIAKGLITLAGALTILGVAGYLLTPVVPSIIGLGFALLLLGAGMALAGAGAVGFATAFAEVVAVGQAGVKVLTDILKTLAQSIPTFMKNFGKGLAAFAKEIKKAGPDFVKAWTTILGAFLDGIIKNTPKMAKAFLTMLSAALRVISQAVPKIVAAGLDLIIGFLQAISNRLPKLIDLGADLIVKLMQGIQRNDQKIAQEGADTIISFVNAVANTIRTRSDDLGRAGGNLAAAIVEGMVKGIGSGVTSVVNAAENMAENALNAAKDFLGISSPSKKFRDEVGRNAVKGMAKGLKDRKSKKDVKDALVAVSKHAIKRARKALRDLEGKKGMDLLEGLDPRWRGGKKNRLLGVSREALKETRKLLRDEHHKDLAKALKAKYKIRPILDMTDIKKGAKNIDKHLKGGHRRPINPYVSSGRARYVSADMADARADVNRATPGVSAETQEAAINFFQNNYSPKALTPIEIYRKTNNQLSMAKEALKKRDSRSN